MLVWVRASLAHLEASKSIVPIAKRAELANFPLEQQPALPQVTTALIVRRGA
jgi:hypothetical protein